MGMIQEDDEVAILSSTQQRVRYFEEAPKNITVPVEELLARIPRQYHSQNADNSHGKNLELPCGEILQGNTPRVRLGLLQELLPDWVKIPDGEDHDLRVVLPAGWLALYFHLIKRSEVIPVEPELTQSPMEVLDEPLKKEPEIVGESVTKKKDDQTPTLSESDPVEIKIAPTPVPEIEAKKGFFASLPIFRRHEPKVMVVEAITRENLPISSDFDSNQSVEKQESSTKDIQPTAISLERLWKLDPQDQLADLTALQALFMTEEKLTLERVIALAGQLPGLKACVLAHGDQVVCSSNAPSGIDLQTLSTQATTMLAQIRESSSLLGLGSVPAITLHAAQGVLSFLYQGDLCLLVLHADRGFVPGVRERLAEMLGHLSCAKALPDSSSSQPTLPI